MSIRSLGVVFLCAASAAAGCRTPPAPESAPPSAASVFFLTRHAEKAGLEDESPLTEAGDARAQALSRWLRDAGVQGIYSTDFARTRATAAPLASALGLEVQLYDPDGLAELADALRSAPGRYLVVGHSDTTPELVGLLGGEPGPPISEDEHDRLYVLHHRPEVGTTTLLLRSSP